MFPIEAERVVRLRSRKSADLPMPIDEDGFLDGEVPVRATLAAAEPGDLLSLDAAAEAQALVVLGEPGLGKTTALRAIATTLRSSGAEVVWLDGADLAEETFADEFAVHLSCLPAAGGSLVDDGSGLTVVVDALDESAMVRCFPRRLQGVLAGRDLASLRLLVGCRTADVPADLADTLEQLFGEATVFVDLAPLRRSDAVALASSLDAPGEGFASEIEALGAGSLAATPLTLGLLVQEFLENGILGESSRDLFERGVMALLDTAGTSAAGDGVSTVDQRRAVAERIAAVMLLSGKRTVFVGRNLDVGKQDLRASDVSDGFERTASGAFGVTPALVGATLGTALFGGRGPDRFAFVHASQAAFLAACYLRRHEPRVPRRQLEGLLLVAAPDGSRTIPVPLREGAAWLASLDPSVGTWLAEIDPESMVGHESYLESDELRATVVRALLGRAGEFELGDHSWTKGLNLSHPGLAPQVLEVLSEFDAQPEEWSDFARCRVALRLAAYARSPELTERLLEIAESTDWNGHLGSLAVEAALAQDADAIPRLVQLLRALQMSDYARQRDPDDELRGHLLDGLWRKPLGIAEVLRALRPRQSQLFGMYWSFLRSFPDQLDDADLAAALAWASERAASTDSEHNEEGLDDNDDVLPDDRPVGAVDAILAAGLIERALMSARALEFMPHVAALIWPRLDRYDTPPVPLALDEDAVGGSTSHLRRALAEALLRHRADSSVARVDIWHMLGGWRGSRGSRPSDGDSAPRSSLLDPSDFGWAVERAHALEETEPLLAAAMAELAGSLFRPHDVDAIEIASRQQDTILWEHLGHWFDAIELEGELADRLRADHGQTRARQRAEEEETAAEAFREDLVELYTSVVDRDGGRFWRLAWSLQIDPDTASGYRRLDDRLLSFPGLSALPADAPARLVGSARAFLLNESDHADEWLGTDTYDRRAWAGYLALGLLDEFGELDTVPLDHMSSWAGAILWFPSVPSETADPSRKGRLIRRSIDADTSRVAELLSRYVRGELRRGGSASEVDAFDATSVRAIQGTWRELIVELRAALLAPEGATDTNPEPAEPLTAFSSNEQRSTARYTWERMVRGLALADSPEVEGLVTSWATADADASATALTARAMAVLLSQNPGVWRRLDAMVRADEDLGGEVAAAIVDAHREVGLLAELDERELGDLYVWLASVYPPEEDPPEQLGGGFFTAAAQARRWRDQVLTAAGNRGTEDAVRVLSELHEQFPSRIVILSNLVRARVAVFATAWQPPSAPEVQALLEDARRRLVRSGQELALLIQETLQAIEADLVRTGQLLWDRLPKADDGLWPWIPKPEAALSAFLAHDLQLRLHDRGVAVNREVLVKQTHPYGAGDQMDILVEATTRADNAAVPTVHRVVIEVKGAWNQEVLTAQRDQLALRYLPESEAGVGVYIVGWYPKELWDASDYRRARVPKATSAELLALLTTQAYEIGSTTGVSVMPIVLTVPRPSPSGPAAPAQ